MMMGTLVLLLTKLGLIPALRFFKAHELENLIAGGGFQIVATERLSRLPDYFIVAKKLARNDQRSGPSGAAADFLASSVLQRPYLGRAA